MLRFLESEGVKSVSGAASRISVNIPLMGIYLSLLIVRANGLSVFRKYSVILELRPSKGLFRLRVKF